MYCIDGGGRLALSTFGFGEPRLQQDLLPEASRVVARI
jgi:hypothetical protein